MRTGFFIRAGVAGAMALSIGVVGAEAQQLKCGQTYVTPFDATVFGHTIDPLHDGARDGALRVCEGKRVRGQSKVSCPAECPTPQISVAPGKKCATSVDPFKGPDDKRKNEFLEICKRALKGQSNIDQLCEYSYTIGLFASEARGTSDQTRVVCINEKPSPLPGQSAPAGYRAYQIGLVERGSGLVVVLNEVASGEAKVSLSREYQAILELAGLTELFNVIATADEEPGVAPLDPAAIGLE